MTNDLSAEEVRALLKLEANARAVSYASRLSATNELRPASSQRHFLMAGQRAPHCILW
jgi:hypothetical protein